jgi:hypothetical protein
VINNESSTKDDLEVLPKADEDSGILVSGFVKISDPETGEVILEQKD